MNYSVLNKRIREAKCMNKLVVLSSSIDLLIGILAIFFGILLLPAIISSCVTGIILCIGFGMYNKLSKKFFPTATSEQLKVVEIEQNIFNKSNIFLSLLDILTGIIAIVVIGIFVNNTIVNLFMCITLYKGTRVVSQSITSMIQLKKFKALYSTLGMLSILYISTRKNHFLKGEMSIMKKFFAWIKANPRVLTAIGLLLSALIVWAIDMVEGLSLPEEIVNYIIAGLTGLGTIFAGWAGLETPTNHAIRTEAVKASNAEKAKAKEEAKKDAEFLAQAQAKLQAQQDAAVKILAAELKNKAVNETKNNNDNIPVA